MENNKEPKCEGKVGCSTMMLALMLMMLISAQGKKYELEKELGTQKEAVASLRHLQATQPTVKITWIRPETFVVSEVFGKNRVTVRIKDPETDPASEWAEIVATNPDHYAWEAEVHLEETVHVGMSSDGFKKHQRVFRAVAPTTQTEKWDEAFSRFAPK